MSFNDFILTLAWPDSLARSANGPYDPLLKPLNLYRDGFYKAGHAALLLIEAKSGTIKYFDFGRYITPAGNGRIRSEKTDPEVVFNIKAVLTKGEITNLAEIVEYTANHPETHGDGILYSCLQKHINANAALHFMNEQQNLGHIPYGPFQFGGSNCSRFVAKTIQQSTRKGGLKFIYPIYGTPSPLGNIFNSSENDVFKFEANAVQVQVKTRFTLHLRELTKHLFFKRNEKIPKSSQQLEGTLEPPAREQSIPQHAQWLGGTGAGAWYYIKQKSGTNFIVGRAQKNGHIDFELPFKTVNKKFTIESKFEFSYPSHAQTMTIIQGGEKIIFSRVL